MQKALIPLARLIRSHGETYSYHPKATPQQSQPWRVDNTTSDSDEAAATLKAILHIKPALASDSLPQGGVRAMGVVLVEGGQTQPQSGDTLASTSQSQQWRMDTAIVLGRAKSATLIEVVLTGHAAQ
ncbi:MAG: hypothetical protein MJE68_21805 [Proteobacteria bacterium]|nr:hypothetical protein [Pseudomonadota bacterium]